MSQAKNKVRWCLNKAKKEIEEGIKHRGLVEIEPDLDEAKNHIKKAEHNFKAVVLLEESGFSDWSVNAICQKPPITDGWHTIISYDIAWFLTLVFRSLISGF